MNFGLQVVTTLWKQTSNFQHR